MAYVDIMNANSGALTPGRGFNPMSNLEALSSSLKSGLMSSSTQRDTQNSLQETDRDAAISALGYDFNAEAKKNVVWNPVTESEDDFVKNIENEKRRLTDEAIVAGRATEPEKFSSIKTTQEMRDVTIAARQQADEDAAYAYANRADPILGAVSAFGGVAAGVMTDPYNAVTLPLGASASTGILRSMAIEGGLNAGIEALQTPGNMQWAKEAGVQYGIGDAALNIATAGFGGAALTGIIRGGGKLLGALEKRGNSKLILDQIAADKKLTSEQSAAATYQSNVAHIDEGSPVVSPLATGEEVAAHRANMQEVQDALLNDREPVIDTSLFVRGADDLKTEIADLEGRITRLQQSTVAEPALPRELAGAKPRYGKNEIQFESDVDRASYIALQAKKSGSDHKYRSFLSDIGMDDAEILAHGAKVKAALKTAAKEAKDGAIALARVERDINATRAELDNKIAGKKAELAKREAAIPKGVINLQESDPPQARAFDKGTKKGARHEGYTKPSPKEWEYIDSVVADLNDAYKGARIFSVPEEAGRGGDLNVMGYKGNFPKWFKELGDDTSISRTKVSAVVEKMRKGEPLGAAEIKIAEGVYSEARALREEHIRQYQQGKAEKLSVAMDEADRMYADELAREARYAANPIEDIVPEKIADPVEYIREKTREMLDPELMAAKMADWKRMVSDSPDMQGEFVSEGADGEIVVRTMTIKEMDAEIADDEALFQAITTCGIG